MDQKIAPKSLKIVKGPKGQQGNSKSPWLWRLLEAKNAVVPYFEFQNKSEGLDFLYTEYSQTWQ